MLGEKSSELDLAELQTLTGISGDVDGLLQGEPVFVSILDDPTHTT